MKMKNNDLWVDSFKIVGIDSRSVDLSNLKIDNSKTILIYPKSLTVNEISNLAKKGFTKFLFFLDSINPRTYEKIWGKDSFEWLWNVIDKISFKYKDKINLTFVCNISKINLHELLPTFGWVVNFGMAKLYFRPVTPNFYSNSKLSSDKSNFKKFLVNDTVLLEKTLNHLIKKSIEIPEVIINNIDELRNIIDYISEYGSSKTSDSK